MRGKFIRRLLPRTKKAWAVVLVAVGVVAAISAGAYAALGGSILQSSTNSIDLQKGLIGHWKMDGNFKDSTPQARNASVTGTTIVPDRKGKPSGAYAFNGTSDTARVDNFDPAVLATSGYSNSWTLSVWVKSSAGNGAEDIIMGKAGCNGGLETGSPNHYIFIIFNSACNVTAQISYAPTDMTQWHLITGTYSNGSMSFYGDGELRGTATAQSVFNYSNVLGFGSGNNGGYHFAGALDDARVYNRALNAVEAKALYESYDTQLNVGSDLNGLIGHWRMDGNAKDSTPNGNNGVVSGAALAADRKSKSNSAYSFSTNTNNIEIPANPALNTSVFTYSAWVRPTSFATAGTIIGTTSVGGPQMVLQASTGRLYLNKQNVVNINGTSGTVPLNTWSHVAVSYDASGNCLFYINGVLQPNLGSVANLQTLTFSNFRIGMKHNTTESFVGTIDDVRIYNRVLRADEVARQYQSYDSQINLNPAAASSGNIAQGLMSSWMFNGNANDATPYSNNGTLFSVTPTADRSGAANKAYSFNGTSSHIDTSNLVSDPQVFSLSAWFKTSSATDQTILSLVDEGEGAMDRQLYVNAQGGVSFYINPVGSNNNVYLDSPANIYRNNAWHHVVVTKSSAGLFMYIDGAQVATVANAPAQVFNGYWRIGMAISYFPVYFSGAIDDVRIYDRALTLPEVQSLYTL